MKRMERIKRIPVAISNIEIVYHDKNIMNVNFSIL